MSDPSYSSFFDYLFETDFGKNDPANPVINYDANAQALNQNSYDLQSMLVDLEKKAREGDTAAFEKLFDYYASQDAAKTARDWTAQREDDQYQRLVEDLGKAGISPYILSGATPGVSQSQFSTTTGSQMTSQENAKRTADLNRDKLGLDVFKTAISLMGTALMALALFA